MARRRGAGAPHRAAPAPPPAVGASRYRPDSRSGFQTSTSILLTARGAGAATRSVASRAPVAPAASARSDPKKASTRAGGRSTGAAAGTPAGAFHGRAAASEERRASATPAPPAPGPGPAPGTTSYRSEERRV